MDCVQGVGIWEFPKIWATFLGGPQNKDYNILGCVLGPLILGNYFLGFPKPQTLEFRVWERPRSR